MKDHYICVRFVPVEGTFRGSEFDPDPDNLWASEEDVLNNWREVTCDLLAETECGEDGHNAILCRLLIDEKELDRFIWRED